MRLAGLLCLVTTPALAQVLEDRHLPVIPRSAEDAALVATLLAPPAGFAQPEPSESQPGGAAAEPSARFTQGAALFAKLWVAAPAPMQGADGLGPLYNARACQDCHQGDGQDDPARLGMVLAVSLPGGPAPADIAEWHATQPDPTYGRQLQDLAAPGQLAEGRVDLHWTETSVTLADGTRVPLRAPRVGIVDQGYGPGAAGLMLSPRIAPRMLGLGLLEAIPAADILALADPADADGDGISGRAQIVPSVEYGVPMLGRFGLKAGKPTLREQAADAFLHDMGLSSPLHPDPWGDCTALQPACREAPHGQDAPGGWEVDAESLDLVTFHSQNLPVPDRRADDPVVLRGKAVFHGLNCSGCHVPKHVTHRLDGRPQHSFRLIWPYTDLLLHDMGPGLADGRPEGRASGQEWRTPPLWGVGQRARWLHDGRARSLLEAILWHGGEAAAQRDAVAALTADDRAALLAFLESL